MLTPSITVHPSVPQTHSHGAYTAVPPPQDGGASRLGWGLTGGGRRGALWLLRLQSANPQAVARMPLPHAPGASARAHGSLYTVLASFPFTGSTFQM